MNSEGTGVRDALRWASVRECLFVGMAVCPSSVGGLVLLRDVMDARSGCRPSWNSLAREPSSPRHLDCRPQLMQQGQLLVSLHPSGMTSPRRTVDSQMPERDLTRL